MAQDAEELAQRLSRIANLTDRLRGVQSDSTAAQELNARIQRETAQLNRPITPSDPNSAK